MPWMVPCPSPVSPYVASGSGSNRSRGSWLNYRGMTSYGRAPKIRGQTHAAFTAPNPGPIDSVWRSGSGELMLDLRAAPSVWLLGWRMLWYKRQTQPWRGVDAFEYH